MDVLAVNIGKPHCVISTYATKQTCYYAVQTCKIMSNKECDIIYSGQSSKNVLGNLSYLHNNI